MLKLHNFKRILLITIFVLLRHCTGAFVLLMYTVDIFAAAGGSLSPNHCAIVIGSVQLAVVVVSNSVTDVVGRKTLIVYSGILMSLSHIIIGVYYFLHVVPDYHETVLEYLSWVPLVCLMIFIGCFSLGFAPALFIFMVELIPQEVKDSVSSLVMVTNNLSAFVVIQFYYKMREGLGEAGIFFFYGCSCLIAAAYCKLVLPETSGKSPEQIDSEVKAKGQLVGAGNPD